MCVSWQFVARHIPRKSRLGTKIDAGITGRCVFRIRSKNRPLRAEQGCDLKQTKGLTQRQGSTRLLVGISIGRHHANPTISGVEVGVLNCEVWFEVTTRGIRLALHTFYPGINLERLTCYTRFVIGLSPGRHRVCTGLYRRICWMSIVVCFNILL